MKVSAKNRSGLLAGGNWIVDHVKILDSWPPQDALANILAESWGNGGSPYNILKGLAKLGAPFPLAAIGLIGTDPDGDRIVDDCRQHGIDPAGLRRTGETTTAYSDVMTERATGRRTFFHQRGTNALLGPEHFDFSETKARIFHLGYLLLLDRLDQIDKGGPLARDVFRRATEGGLLTSLDCVSENSDRFQAVVKPVLPEIDFLFVNDFEAEKLTGIVLRSEGGAINRGAVEEAAGGLLAMGVRRWVVLHFPEGAYAFGLGDQGHWQASLSVPPDAIKGAAGAGDAFAAGVLYGLHEDWDMPRALRLGVCAAASSLFDATCSNGVRKANECLALEDRHPPLVLPD